MEAFFGMVILKPTKKQEEDGTTATIVVPLQGFMARDTAHATAKLLKLVPEEHQDKDSQLEAKVSSFR